jgi:GH24 family phage-related lysozyme (muramidase)
MVRKVSADGLKFIEKWEELVLYVYDDKMPKRRINGVLQYPEWNGGEVRGTLTIGYGHTDAAGYPKITQGMRITEAQANEILENDLLACRRDVERIVKVDLNQPQFDALVSFDFNCGAGNLKKLTVDLNKGNYNTMPRKMMQYVSSKGERMQGLVNRRAGEVQMWETPDDSEEAAAMPLPSTSDRDDPPKGMVSSKTGNASLLTGIGGGTVALSTISDTTSTVKDIKSNVDELGAWHLIEQAIHQPLFWVGVFIFVAAGFIYWDRSRKLTEEHV